MSELAAEIRKIAEQFPDSRSATIPALRLAQQANGGWLATESFEQVGSALGLTPAYCQAVASFYDMFHLAPVGRHLVEVCTNLSCALVGAQRVVDAFESELGVAPGETTEDGEVTLRDGRVPRRLRLRDRRRRRQPLPPARQARGRARDRGGAPCGLRAMLLAGADERDLTKLAEYQAIGGYEQVPKARKLSSDELIAELQEANLRGRGGAGFPMGRKASLVDRASPKPKYLVVNADESEPGAFKDREVMARVPHRLLEGCLIAAHAIESKDVFIYIRGEYLTEYEILQARGRRGARGGALRRRERDRLPRRRRVHLRRGDGAARLARGPARPAAPAAAVPAGAGPLHGADQINNVCTIATVPAILELGADGVRPGRHAQLAGHRALLDLRQRREAGQLRARARHLDARADLHARGRDRRRPPAEGGHPRRLLGAGADRATRSTCRSTTTRWARSGRSSAPPR